MKKLFIALSSEKDRLIEDTRNKFSGERKRKAKEPEVEVSSLGNFERFYTLMLKLNSSNAKTFKDLVTSTRLMSKLSKSEFEAKKDTVVIKFLNGELKPCQYVVGAYRLSNSTNEIFRNLGLKRVPPTGRKRTSVMGESFENSDYTIHVSAFENKDNGLTLVYNLVGGGDDD